MRKESREKVFQTLFMMDVLGIPPEKAIPLYAMTSDTPPSDEAYYRGTVEGVFDHLEEIDLMISSVAANWRIERMALVDRNILRLGTFEICHSSDVPFVVAINEAVELAKRFGSVESGGFINGILDRISEISRKKKGQA